MAEMAQQEVKEWIYFVGEVHPSHAAIYPPACEDHALCLLSESMT